MKIAAAILLFLTSFGLSAQKIYTWKDEFGTTHFTTTPPPEQGVEEAELGEAAASGLGGTTVNNPMLSTGNSNNTSATAGNELTYSEKQEIQRLENRSQRQGIPSNLKRFYTREIKRIEEGRSRSLSDEKKALRQKHLNLLLREFNSEEDISASIKIIDDLYSKKSR
jgi:hypothetical protein